MGHEFIGKVTNTGEKCGNFLLGKRVAVNPLISCGKCYSCSNGNENYCEELRVIGFGRPGGMAEYTNQDINQVIPIKNEVKWQKAVLIEPLAVAINALENVSIDNKKNIVILGGGTIGYLICKLIKNTWPDTNLIVLTRRDTWRKLFENINCYVFKGIDEINNYINMNLKEAGIDIVFECTGSEEIASEAIKLIRRGGTILLVGIPKKNKLLKMKKIQDRSLNIKGISMYNRNQFAKAVSMVNDGFNAEEVISDIFSLDRIGEAFYMLVNKKEESRKVVIRGEEYDI